MSDAQANSTRPSGRVATKSGSCQTKFEKLKCECAEEIGTPRNADGPACNSPSSRSVGSTSARQSGCALVQAGKITRASALTFGGPVQLYWLSQRPVSGVSSDWSLRTSKSNLPCARV